ncbi:mRNA capping enzyme large subunit [Nile crocodilepox virus]|uniref:mRNA-capping enzyme catalytic subunit n=1 Tax=Nile crocodilepox virus (isolate Crocodylus niloticus/Zimbabwe/Ume/2001) TaxID=1289473 RepID=Q070E2_CPRVZ|nr:mRNA capping enzyme large subunit [Nile crocodilepox virus]ABJ09000.1 mRNA capping enzyme large subunit [Nile crocodilepox virus]
MENKLGEPLSAMLDELVDYFESAFRENRFDAARHNEVELILLNPPLSAVSVLHTIATVEESYVQYVLKAKDAKIRNRLSVKDVHGLDVKNYQLVERLDDANWERKAPVWEKSFPGATIKHSTEESHPFTDYRNYSGNIKLEFVNLVRARAKHLIVDAKFKYFIGNGSQNYNSLLYALNDPAAKPGVTLEFEIDVSREHLEREGFSFAELRASLYTVCQALFLAPADSVFLVQGGGPRPPVPTNMLKKYQLQTLETADLYVTEKTDGVLTYVLLRDKDIFCHFAHLGYFIRYRGRRKFAEPVSLMGEMTRAGSGEKVVHFIKLQTPALPDRLEERAFVEERLSDLGGGITIAVKRYHGPYATNGDLIAACATLLREYREGVILFYRHAAPCDWKLKKVNTVDQAVNVVYRYMSNEPIILGDRDTFVEFKRYSNAHGTPKEFGFGKLVLSDGVNYLGNIYCLEFLQSEHDTGLERVLVPVKFVGEFSTAEGDDSLVRPRLEKTMLYLYSRNYYGNQEAVILEHLEDQRVRLGELLTGAPDVMAEAGKRVARDALRLNPDGSYFSQNRTRGPLGILSNFVKTQTISLYCSKTFMDNNAKRKVLAVDFGNGADLEKYFYAEAAVLIATDPDPAAIAEANSRYNKLNSGSKSKYYKFAYLQATIRSDAYLDEVRKTFYSGRFDVIDWQFAVHFSFHPLHYSTVMRNLAELAAPGAKVLITTMDGDYVASLAEERRFVIHRTQAEDNYLSIEKISDEKALVFSPTTMKRPMEEYIVRRADLNRVFEEYGFRAIDYVTFYDVIARNRKFLAGVSKLEARPSTSKFFALNRDAVNFEGTDLEELLRRYVVYVFCKA